MGNATMLENSNDNATSEIEKNFIDKFISGDLGLARTYWLYGVFVGFVVNFVITQIPSIEFLVLFLIGYTAYEVALIMAIWRAAKKYEGLKIWTVLAKIAVSLGAIMLVFGWVKIVEVLIQ